MGGHINNYLLEKSRVIDQQTGENNFHSFYQLLKGAPEGTLKKMGLGRDASVYRYLCQNNNKVQMPQKVSERSCVVLRRFMPIHYSILRNNRCYLRSRR